MVNLNEPMRFDVLDGAVFELNVTGLQPDTNYNVQVAALTRKGDGDRSEPVSIKTPGGVPNRPTITIKLVKKYLLTIGAVRAAILNEIKKICQIVCDFT